MRAIIVGNRSAGDEVVAREFAMIEFCTRAMPYIKADLTHEPGPALTLEHDDAPVLRDLSSGLLVAYVVDAGDSFEYVQNRHLLRAGMTAESLHAMAMNNFLAFVQGRTRMISHGNVVAMFLDGNFEASLLLVDELWDQSLLEYAESGFVVAVPARDVLAFTDRSSADGIAELRALVGRVFPDGDHLIALDLYSRAAGGWVKFEG